MTLTCDRCGAPLEAKPGDLAVKCAFCHATQQVAAPAPPPPPAPLLPTPMASPYWTPPPQSAPALQAPIAIAHALGPARPVRRALGCIFVAPTVMVVVGVVVALVAGRVVRGVDANAPPTLGQFSFASSGPMQRTGSVVGDYYAGSLAPTCRGYVTRAPQIVLNLRGPAALSLGVESPTDTTLVVRRPDGSYLCDDDSGGSLNPAIGAAVTPGRYVVWVGTIGEKQPATFNLTFQADALDGPVLPNGLSPSSTPALGVVDLDHTPYTEQAADTRPWIDVSTLYPQCHGWMSIAPTLSFRTSTVRNVVLTTRASADLTMLVRDAAGNVQCDDDSGEGQNPMIRGSFAPGAYQVWVGPYRHATKANYTLIVQTGDAPGQGLAIVPDAQPTNGTVDLDAFRGIRHVPGTLHGEVNAQTIGPSCRGFVAGPPDVVLHLTRRHAVTVRARSTVDTTLVMRHGAHDFTCADDSRFGTDALLELSLDPGDYPVWVGRYTGSSVGSYDLELTVR